MQEIQFKADGFTEEDVRRWKKLTQTSVFAGPILGWTGLFAVAVYSLGTLTPVALFNREAVISKRLYIIRDVSGSMGGTEQRLQRLLEHLKESGVIVDRRTADGFGVSTTGNSRNLLNQLKEGLKGDSDVDAVYVFSDFTYIDEPIDGSNDAGYQQLRQLLRDRGIRLYLGTVRAQPPKKMVDIAEQSGGGMIESK